MFSIFSVPEQVDFWNHCMKQWREADEDIPSAKYLHFVKGCVESFLKLDKIKSILDLFGKCFLTYFVFTF